MIERFEDDLPRFRRALRRAFRAVRWPAKRLLGRPATILVELRWRLGDEIMALPIYEALKRRHPHSTLQALCAHPELLEGNPYVDAANPPAPDPDRYIFLREAPRQRYRRAHYAALAGVECPAAPPRLYIEEWGTPLLPPSDRPYAAIAPGASWPTKRWPESHWRTLIEALRSAGFAVAELGADHRPVGADVDLVGRTTVGEAARVLRGCQLLVTNDSGLMHLALAAGTRVLALFGPTDPDILIRDEPRLYVVDNGRPCRGCWNVSLAMTEPGLCPLNVASCMETIGPEAVIERALALLKEPA